MDKHLDKLNELIFKEKYTIRPVHLVNLFGLHIKQAQFLLECFVEKHKDLIVKYGLIGHQGELDDEIGSRRYVEVEICDIEDEKKNFTKLVGCSIKSIRDKHNSLNINYPNHQKVFSNEDELIDYQKKGFIINEKVKVREDKVRALIVRSGEDSLNKSKPNNKRTANDSNLIEQKPAIKKATKISQYFQPIIKPKDDEFVRLKKRKNEDEIKTETISLKANKKLKVEPKNQTSIMNFLKPKNQSK